MIIENIRLGKIEDVTVPCTLLTLNIDNTVFDIQHYTDMGEFNQFGKPYYENLQYTWVISEHNTTFPWWYAKYYPSEGIIISHPDWIEYDENNEPYAHYVNNLRQANATFLEAIIELNRQQSNDINALKLRLGDDTIN